MVIACTTRSRVVEAASIWPTMGGRAMLVLDVGANRFEGRGRDLLDDPKVAELYLGGTARLESADAGGEDEGRGATGRP